MSLIESHERQGAWGVQASTLGVQGWKGADDPRGEVGIKRGRFGDGAELGRMGSWAGK